MNFPVCYNLAKKKASNVLNFIFAAVDPQEQS
jgi:hypothetical protein